MSRIVGISVLSCILAGTFACKQDSGSGAGVSDPSAGDAGAGDGSVGASVDPNPGPLMPGNAGTPPAATPPATTDMPAPGATSPGPISATYVRGSLKPLFELTPRAEYGRIQNQGIAATDNDFAAANVGSSAAQKMDEIGALLNPPDTIIKNAADRDRAQTIPFRGNPSDVKVVTLDDGTKKIYVPLGGDITTPGNEVAVVQNLQLRTRIKVGLRPQKVAVHPAGLVFVCNQYSNYISIIDPRTDQPLAQGATPVEVPTEYYCADMVFVPKNPRAPNVDQQWLYVANRWRKSVLKYSADIVRDPISNRPTNVITGVGKPPKAVAEITNVGANPLRLSLSEQQNAIYVANGKGGEIARIDINSGAVTQRVGLGAPSQDIVNIADLVFVPTTMQDRGLLAADDQHPQQVTVPPVTVQGMDGKPHVAHPGSLFDNTKSYNFEDLRDGILQLDFQLQRPVAQATYYTDDVSSEPNFVAQQKILSGSIPEAVVRNAAGTAIFMTNGGNSITQQLRVNTAAQPFALTPVRNYTTGAARPFGVALDEKNNRLYVANWGQETLDCFDVNSGRVLASIDLGYAQPTYPASNVERGEKFFYDTTWSNNTRKSCATCHIDELDVDGFGYSNGAQAPTVLHQVKPNHNLMTTDAYFWNGSFGDGNYTSLAFFAQTRTNCEVVEFGMVEGPGSNPATRIGDPNNQFTNGQDDKCRPISNGPSSVANQADIDAVDAAEKAITAQKIQQITGFDKETLSRFIDLYDVAELRLPPNPLRQLYDAGQLDAGTTAQIKAGKQLFDTNCALCHDPTNTRHPYADGLNHGSAADWTRRFVDTYRNDPLIVASIGTFSQTLLDAVPSTTTPDHEVNIHLDPIDFFIPFCFDVTNCLEFDDPLQARGNRTEEARRLNLLIKVNLADPDRGFVPGNVRGSPMINTPSLRGVWTQDNILRMAQAHNIREAILAPGHPALQPGENGYAIDALGQIDSHGTTSKLTAAEVAQLELFVKSIQ